MNRAVLGSRCAAIRRRFSEFSKILGKLAGLSEKACEVLCYSSPLHDVGKIGIADRILLKPGKLDQEEFRIMKLHTVIGAGPHRLVRAFVVEKLSLKGTRIVKDK
jgi:response regulator RpfG family c-di-GMP phosphodiesterase